MGSPRRIGFTLAEVAISLALLVATLVTVLMFFAAGLRSQQQNRFQMYAAAIATSLTEAFSQPREDFKASSGDLTISSLTTSANLGRALRDNFLYGSAGEFDLERALATSIEGIYPVPTAIARRLDSGNDEIRRVLDQGGHLYYVDPYPVRGFGRGATGADRAAVPELQRLVFAVVGNAQQNALPAHPSQIPRRLLYPFPPQVRASFHGRVWGGGQAQYNGFPAGFSGNLRAADRLHDNAPTTGGSALDQGNNWEWLAQVDERRGLAADGPHPWQLGAAWSPWRAGVHEFRRLAHWHWLRIHHQLDETALPLGGTTVTIRRPDPSRKIQRTVRRSRLTEDRHRQVTVVEYDEIIEEQDPSAWITETRPAANDLKARGVPAPPLGLPQAQGLRGTDILYEDHETNSLDRLSQLRIGLPGLERRVMYRTAALALWAKVDGHPSIIRAAAEVLGTASDPLSDPNVIDLPGNLPDDRNPLLGVVMPPANARDIHPAQVLALSYLAHAAMMASGYQPPFIDERNAVDPDLHQNLVTDESLPYKDLSAEEYVVRDPFYASSLVPPVQPDSEQEPVLATTAAAGDDWAALDASGQPIRARRLIGPILNPFPPPYADRGAFSWTGAAFARPVPQAVAGGYRITWRPENYGAAGPIDSTMAQYAHETCLRWVMAYTAEHPYDLVVPKPLNRQTSFDRPLFAFDLFTPTGAARRPTPPVSDAHFHPVMWGSDRARFGMRNASPLSPLSFEFHRSYTTSGASPGTYPLRASSTNHLDILGLFKPYTTHTEPGEVLADGYAKRRFRPGFDTATQISRQRLLNALHGIPPGPGGTVLDPASSPLRQRWWYNRSFAVADRCRQMVFWAVDWKSYEDAESAPSAVIDHSQLGVQLSYSRPLSSSPLAGRGNPERWLAWITPARDGTMTRPPADFTNGAYDTRVDALGTGIRFTNLPHTDKAEKVLWVALGQWGADRNGNGVWDRGPVRAQVRMRAVEVGRYVFYDPVIRTTVRN